MFTTPIIDNRPQMRHGSYLCTDCGGTLHAKWEPKYATTLCAGCYNEK
jgi:hypothetical protein